VEKWLQSAPSAESADKPFLLNAGELADSLAFPPEDNPHIRMLLDAFGDAATNPYDHKLLLVTKAGNVEAVAHLARVDVSRNVIVSFSLGNACAGEFEPHWDASHRIIGMAWAAAAGYRVRVRIDPLIAHPRAPYTAREHARGLAEILASASSAQSAEGRCPELITLGTLRHRGGRVKLPAEERASIYRAAIEGLRAGGYEGPIGLCKETPQMIREVLGIEPGEMRCNCLP
jgi:DNA repair photolyase